MIYFELAKRFWSYGLVFILGFVIWGQHLNNKRLNLEKVICQTNYTQLVTANRKQAAANEMIQAERDRLSNIVNAEHNKLVDQIENESAGNTCEEAIAYGIAKGQLFK